MRSSFSGFTYDYEHGVRLWSRGRQIVNPYRPYCGPRCLFESGALATICGGLERDEVGRPWWGHGDRRTNSEGVRCVAAAVHVSHARRTDCEACRAIYRRALRERRSA